MVSYPIPIEIPPDRVVRLPATVPVGPAVVVIVQAEAEAGSAPARKLGARAALGLLAQHREAFGERDARELLEEALAEKYR